VRPVCWRTVNPDTAGSHRDPGTAYDYSLSRTHGVAGVEPDALAGADSDTVADGNGNSHQ
jgi:hypothetical protein